MLNYTQQHSHTDETIVETKYVHVWMLSQMLPCDKIVVRQVYLLSLFGFIFLIISWKFRLFLAYFYVEWHERTLNDFFCFCLAWTICILIVLYLKLCWKEVAVLAVNESSLTSLCVSPGKQIVLFLALSLIFIKTLWRN